MSRRNLPHTTAGIVGVIVAGLGLGYAAARFWNESTSPPAPEPGGSEVSRAASQPAPTVRKDGHDPAPPPKNPGRRGLLVGVTKYDHLPKGQQLAGPGNDVRLMRRLLQERYQFPADGIASLTEDESNLTRRPTRANIEREFRQLADQAREGDQVVILLAGHGSRQPESNPPDPENPEPDGIDEIFLPADVSEWKGFPERVPNAILTPPCWARIS